MVHRDARRHARRQGIERALQAQVLNVAGGDVLKAGGQTHPRVQELRVVVPQHMRDAVHILLIKVGDVFAVSQQVDFLKPRRIACLAALTRDIDLRLGGPGVLRSHQEIHAIVPHRRLDDPGLFDEGQRPQFTFRFRHPLQIGPGSGIDQ